MISENDEYKMLIKHRLSENMKSFKILYDIKHYGNCVSIMCQELNQIMKLLFLLNSNPDDRKLFIHATVNSQKWYTLTRDNKKEYITDEMQIEYAKSLSGWDKSIYEFGLSFNNLSTNLNYGSKDPIKSMSEYDRGKLLSYIQEYHMEELPADFILDDIIPVLPLILEEISNKLQIYLRKI
jgi:hypothetical protein